MLPPLHILLVLISELGPRDYKCVLTTQTPSVKAAHMRLPCCLRQWISALTARSTAAVGAAPLSIVHAHVRAHTRTHMDVSLHMSSQSHCQDQTLKTHLLNPTSAQFGVLNSVSKNKDWNFIFAVIYHHKVCCQNLARADSFSFLPVFLSDFRQHFLPQLIR